MTDHSVLAAARRARPVHEKTVKGSTYRIRMPTMAAVREFQNTQGAGDNEKALTILFAECLVGNDGEADLTQEQARELAGMAWISRDLLDAILEVALPKATEEEEGKHDGA